MLSCLAGYIGYWPCDGAAPESGLYLHELQGISLESVDKIADSDQRTFENVLSDIEKRALNRLSTEVRARFARRYRLLSLTEFAVFGDRVNTANLTAAVASELRGFRINLDYHDFGYVKSNFQVLHIQSLSIYLQVPGNTTLKVIDLDSGQELDTFTVNGQAGWNSVILNRDYTSRNLFFGYAADSIDSVETEIPTDLVNTLLGACGCDCAGTGNCQSRIVGSTYNTGTGLISSSGDNTYGVRATLSIQCRFDAVVCNNKLLFRNALWYLLGYELMNERMFSSRVNRFTTIDRSRAEELRGFFLEEFERELDSTVDGIQLDDNDCCLQCDAPVKYGYSLM